LGMPPMSVPLRLGLVNLFHYLSMMASVIFLPLYASELGASNLLIGLIVAAYGMAYFLSSLLFGRLSDVHGRLTLIRVGLVLSTIAFPLQFVAASPLVLLAVRGAIGFCLGMSSAALAAYVYEEGGRVGSFASYGALGWLLASLAGALIGDFEGMFILSTASSFLAFLLTLAVTEYRQESVRVSAVPIGVIWSNRKIYLPFLFRNIGAGAVWAIFPLFLVSMGASLPWVAILHGINMGSQFVVMRLIQRYNSAMLFTMGLLINVLVFALYGIVTGYLQVVPMQFLVAAGWSCMLVGALTYVLTRNQERGTAAGMLYSTIYFSGGLGPLLGGGISQVWGYSAVMFAASALSFVGLLSSRGLSTRVGHTAEQQVS